jgi:hypothetical protein
MIQGQMPHKFGFYFWTQLQQRTMTSPFFQDGKQKQNVGLPLDAKNRRTVNAVLQEDFSSSLKSVMTPASVLMFKLN